MSVLERGSKMKLKMFRAPSMPQALAQVKRHLGPDAVIVQTRSYKRGGIFGIGARNIVEITARSGESDPPPRSRAAANRLQRLYSNGRKESYRRSDITNSEVTTTNSSNIKRNVQPPARQARQLVPASKGVQRNAEENQIKGEIKEIRQLVENLVKEQRHLHEPQMPEQLFDLYLDLIQREVADEIARDLVKRISHNLSEDQIKSADIARQKLVQVMDQMISTTGPISPNLNGKARVVALIGPTGVGKTTTIAKIAANLKLRQNKKVALITIDTYRIGAVDQLRMYAQIIDVPLKVVLTPAELKEAVESLSDLDVVLIDTAGRCQNDRLKLTELKTFMEAARPDEIHLVLSSTTHHAHMLSAVEKFGALGVDRIILTKLDEAISFGVVLSVLRKIDASISYITTGQDVPDDIEVGNGRRLAQLLLGMELVDMNQPNVLENVV